MKIVENAVPQKLFDSISKNIFDTTVPFYLIKDTSTGNDLAVFDPLQSSWQHLCFDCLQGGITSTLYPSIKAAVISAFDGAEEKMESLLRIRIVLITSQSINIVHKPHIDRVSYHKNALLYMNDSDGDTLLYKQRYDYNQTTIPTHKNINENLNLDNYDIEFRSSPKANKMIFFDGDRYHASSTPTNVSARITININYI